MKRGLLLAVALWAAGPAWGQDDSGGDGGDTTGGKPATSSEVDHSGDREGVAVHLPTQFKSDNDLQKLITSAKAAQKDYVEHQNTLQAKLKSATTAERIKVLTAIKDNQDRFLDDTRRLREEIRNRISALKSELKNSKPIDAGSGGGATHPHRGH